MSKISSIFSKHFCLTMLPGVVLHVIGMALLPKHLDSLADINQPSRAQVLVIVADHGSGTSTFGAALNHHPCVFDVGEPFGRESMLWTTTHIAGCDSSRPMPPAMFDGVTGNLKNASNPKLDLKIEDVMKKLPGSLPHIDMNSLYDGLDYNLADYFVRIHNLVCSAVPNNVCAPSECTILVKMFPAYVNADTDGQLTNDDHLGACQQEENNEALKPWKAALASFSHNPKVATLKLYRDEEDRQFSMFHRFDAAGTLFDCSIHRSPTPFAEVSEDYVDDKIEVVNCWKGPSLANKCLGEALALVGLSAEPMGQKGTDEILGLAHTPGTPSKQGAATRNCHTDPEATFERLANSDVQCVAHCDSPVPSHGNRGRDAERAHDDDDDDNNDGPWRAR